MSEQDSELEAFSKFIVALEPWLSEVVLVGGWAHRLYRLDPRARELSYLPLTTLDGDVAVPLTLKEQESTAPTPGLGEGRPTSTRAGIDVASDRFSCFYTQILDRISPKAAFSRYLGGSFSGSAAGARGCRMHLGGPARDSTQES